MIRRLNMSIISVLEKDIFHLCERIAAKTSMSIAIKIMPASIKPVLRGNDSSCNYFFLFPCTAGFDYSPINETLVIPVGISRICVNITIIDDGTVESRQAFGVILISETPSLFTVSDAGRQSTVIIIDDEGTGIYIVMSCVSLVESSL